MESYTFRYTPVSIPSSDPFPDGQTVYRPLLIVRLVEPVSAKSFKCLVCVDTGADHCVFPLSFAGAIGLDPIDMPSDQTAGVGNTGNITYYANVRIEIPLKPGASLAFATMAGFTAGIEHAGMGLLGQMGFFEAFQAVFKRKEQTFSILA